MVSCFGFIDVVEDMAVDILWLCNEFILTSSDCIFNFSWFLLGVDILGTGGFTVGLGYSCLGGDATLYLATVLYLSGVAAGFVFCYFLAIAFSGDASCFIGEDFLFCFFGISTGFYF